MPRGDRTGPAGEGPMTGRGAGYCSGNDAPGFTDRAFSGRGGMGFGGWLRPGNWTAYGRGGGRGYRNRFYETGVPFRAYGAPPSGGTLGREEEATLLRSESERLKSVLDGITQRLAKLEKDKK